MVQQLSDAEFEIMKILWSREDAMTSNEIVLLSRLMQKGFLSARKIGRRNEYTTLISETEYQTAQTKNFLHKVYEGNVKGLVSNLISGDLLSDEEYDELKELLEKGRGEL